MVTFQMNDGNLTVGAFRTHIPVDTENERAGWGDLSQPNATPNNPDPSTCSSKRAPGGRSSSEGRGSRSTQFEMTVAFDRTTDEAKTVRKTVSTTSGC